MVEQVRPAAARAVWLINRELALMGLRDLRRAAASLPWHRRPLFWLRVWRETT